MTEEWRAQRPKKPRDGPRTEYTAADWLLQMKLAEKRNDKWESRCKKIIKRYRNQHFDDGNEGAKDRRGMNTLWSNVETLSPSIYGREPVPICERRFLDKDVVGRVAAQILERALRYEMGDSGFNDTVEQNIKDYLLVGRGVPWLRYKPVIGQATSLADRGDDDLSGQDGTDGTERTDEGDDVEAEDRDGDEPTDETPQEKLLAAGLEIDYVYWADFFTSNARVWKQTEWVARRFFPSRDDLCDDFGDEIGKAVPLEMAPDHEEMRDGGRSIEEAPDSQRKAIAWEIWHKPTRKVYTVAKGFDKYLEEPRDDPLNLDKFYPCPKPLSATMTNDTLEPVPDYLEYQDQALQIDDLTNRISLLTKALKVSGLYDAANKDLARLLDEGNENKMVPVANWAQLSAKGGLEAAVTFMPIKEIAETLEGLVAARDKVKQDMFEITGMSDIIRGQSDPRETAAAVNTKGRWGSLRLQARQAAVARFCRDIIAMMGEVIAEHYTPEMLVNISGAMYDEGIGGPAPEKPPKPDLPPPVAPPQNPMLGHNGVPPMGGPAILPPGTPSVQNGLPGSAAGIGNLGPHRPNPMAMVQPPGLGPQPGMLHAGPPAPMAPGAAPPPLPPQVQYALAMQQWQAQMQEHLLEKQTIIMKAITLLKEDKMRGFRIDIETDSTVQQDAQEDKQARTEFIAATTKFVEQAFQIGAQAPDAVPMLGKMLLFGVRGFRAGRDLESSIEEFVDKMEGDAKKRQSAPPPPNPELQKQQLELQGIQAKSQAEVQKAQTDAASSAADNQREMASKAADAQNAQAQNAMQMEEMRQKAAYEAQANAFKLRELELKMRATEQEHSHTIAQMNAGHAQRMGELGAKIDNPEGPPMEGARRAPDGNFYIQHPATKQFYRVDKKESGVMADNVALTPVDGNPFVSLTPVDGDPFQQNMALTDYARTLPAGLTLGQPGYAPLNDFAPAPSAAPQPAIPGLAGVAGDPSRSMAVRLPAAIGSSLADQGMGLARSAWGAATLPGDVAKGLVDPSSPEAIRRSTDLAGLLTLPAGTSAEVNPDVLGAMGGGRAASGEAMISDPKAAILAAMKTDPKAKWGLRVTEGPLNPGDSLSPSRVWNEDDPTEGLLPGVSTVGIKKATPNALEETLAQSGIGSSRFGGGNYFGKHVSLIKGDNAIPGFDPGESVLTNPVVHSIYEKADENRGALLTLAQQPSIGQTVQPPPPSGFSLTPVEGNPFAP